MQDRFINAVNAVKGRQLGDHEPATTSNARQLVSLVELNLAALQPAMQPAPVRFIYAQNLAALSEFFTKIIDIDWTKYYGDQCRHTYKASHIPKQVEFDFRPNGGRCKVKAANRAASYFKPCLFHPMVAPASIDACVGPDCGPS